MEYCGGGSVADLMHASDQPLDQDMIAYICADTLAGLAYLHSIGKVQSFLGLHLLQHQAQSIIASRVVVLGTCNGHYAIVVDSLAKPAATAHGIGNSQVATVAASVLEQSVLIPSAQQHCCSCRRVAKCSA